MGGYIRKQQKPVFFFLFLLACVVCGCGDLPVAGWILFWRGL